MATLVSRLQDLATRIAAEFGAVRGEIAEPDFALNFTGDSNVYIPAYQAMTLSQGNDAIGTGAFAFAKSTTAAPTTFTSTSLPVALEAGAWLRVSATGVSGFLATQLRRTA